MAAGEIRITAQPGWSTNGDATLVINKITYEEGLDYKVEQIANFTLGFWETSSEVVLTEITEEDGVLSSEVVYSREVA